MAVLGQVDLWPEVLADRLAVFLLVLRFVVFVIVAGGDAKSVEP